MKKRMEKSMENDLQKEEQELLIDETAGKTRKRKITGIFSRNHIVITVLVLMIAVAGYLNFSYFSNDSEDMLATLGEGSYDISDSDLDHDTSRGAAGTEVAIMSDQGELTQIAQTEEQELFTDTDSDESTENDSDSTQKEAIETSNTSNTDSEEKETASDTGEAVLVSNTISPDFFSSARLSREQTRAKNKETLMSLVEDASLSEAQKQEALDEVIMMTDFAEKETAAELMLESKGFPDAVVTMADSGVDVIVECSHLNRQHIAQIQDIVKRKTGVNLEDIVINPVALD